MVPRTPTSSSSLTACDEKDTPMIKAQQERKISQESKTPHPGIPITKFRSLEPPTSPALPLARVLSGPRDEQDVPIPNEYPGRGTEDDPYLVDWQPGERANPYNWPTNYRWFVTAVVAMSTLCISFASSAYSSAVGEIALKFNVSRELAVTGLSFYVVGFGVGPMLWAPLSEIYGRNFAFKISYPIFTIFNVVGAVSQNIETVLISRFIAGTFGAAPITNAGGQVSDMWAAHERALATSFFSVAPFLGPVLGPIVGGFVAQNKGFRWVFWVQFFFALIMLILSLLIVPETYAPTLLRRKAARLQATADEQGTGEYFIAHYDKIKLSKAEVLKINLIRPFQLLFQELIAFCLAVYGAIIYGTLYLFFEAFPIVFQENRGWSLGISGLAFTGIGVGLVLGNIVTPFFTRYYNRAVKRAEAQGRPVPPEARLVGCSVGATLLPIGLFWFAWTSTPNIHWAVPIIASIPFGMGFLLIFTGMQLYLIDAYALYAASALAGSAVFRSLAGSVFPLFTGYMYKRLGLQWAGTLVAFLALACTPMPLLFYRYGAFLRRKSKYAPSGPEEGKEPQCPEAALEPEYARDAGEEGRRSRASVV